MSTEKRKEVRFSDNDIRQMTKSAVDLKAAVNDMDSVMERLSYNTQLTTTWKQARNAIGDFIPRALRLAVAQRSRIS